MFGIVTVIALIPAYLASRWTQHRRPLARAMAAIGIGVIVSVFFGAFGPGWSNQTMASSGTWIVSLIVLRAPNRLAVWARGTLIAGVVLFAQVVGSVVDVVAFAMPLLIVAVDSLTIRAGYGQFERGQEFVPGVAIHKDAHSTPQNGEE